MQTLYFIMNKIIYCDPKKNQRVNNYFIYQAYIMWLSGNLDRVQLQLLIGQART